MLCTHVPNCPDAKAIDHDAARAITHDDNLNATVLCNGVIVFSDLGELVPEPDGTYHQVAPIEAPAEHHKIRDPRFVAAELDLLLLQLQANINLLGARNAELEATVGTGKARVLRLEPQTVMWSLLLLSVVWMYVVSGFLMFG